MLKLCCITLIELDYINGITLQYINEVMLLHYADGIKLSLTGFHYVTLMELH